MVSLSTRLEKLPPPLGAGVTVAPDGDGDTVRLPKTLLVSRGDALTAPPSGAAVLVLVLLAEAASPGVLLGVLLPEAACTAALGEGLGVTRRAQDPAELAVMPAVLQHAQAAQVPPSCNALAAQQQPPRHSLVPQSKSELQDSPGE